MAPFLTMEQIILDHSALQGMKRKEYMDLQQLRAEVLRRIA
jgi:hypothetical protein